MSSCMYLIDKKNTDSLPVYILVLEVKSSAGNMNNLLVNKSNVQILS